MVSWYRIFDECGLTWRGYMYEMGGTWVTHWMGYLQKEMERYGMEDDLILTRLKSAGDDFYSLNVPGEPTMSALCGGPV